MVTDILCILWAVALCVTAETVLHPIETEDLKNIVDSVKRDVDRHLKKISAGSQIKPVSVSNPQANRRSAIIDDVDNFLKLVQESMHHHLVRNLGDPLDANIGSTIDIPSTSSTLRQPLEPFSSKSSNSSESLSDDHESLIGYTKGVPGIDFPDYTDIPITSFSCADKNIPGFYADLDTGCQIFHVCWPDRRESFLCPMGTIFNQAHLVCDYWYHSNCSFAPYYYTVNMDIKSDMSEAERGSTDFMTDTLKEKLSSLENERLKATSVATFITQFMPVKAKVVVYPETASKHSKIISASTDEHNEESSRLKPRLKHYISRRSRLPRSVDSTNVTTHDDIEEMKLYIKMYRISEVLNLTLMSYKNKMNDEELSEIFPYMEKIIRFSQLIISRNKSMEPIELEPGSELYEYDMDMKKNFEEKRQKGDNLLRLARLVKIIFEIFGLNITSENQKSDLKIASTTQLNPQLSDIRASEQIPESKVEDETKTVEKLRVKRESNASDSMKVLQEGGLNINLDTKKALFKNYVKQFNIKRSSDI